MPAKSSRLVPTVATVLCLLVVVAFGLGQAAPAEAAELAGVSMADRATVGGESLVLNGLGLRKKAIFKVYVAGLYLPTRQSDPAKILATDSPRMLAMEFLRSVGKGQLSGAWNDCLEQNVSNADAEVKKGFSMLDQWMGDVETGDRLRFVYEPGKGTSVELKNRKAGTVEGRAFADALFSCWIGDVPPSADFKAGLLGDG